MLTVASPHPEISLVPLTPALFTPFTEAGPGQPHTKCARALTEDELVTGLEKTKPALGKGVGCPS